MGDEIMKEEELEEVLRESIIPRKNQLKDPVTIRNIFLLTFIWSFGSFAFFMIPFYLD